LTQDVITNDPERQFYQRQIETAGTEARAAGRWADSEMVVEFGERRADDRLSGAPIGEGQTHAVSVVQPIEFGGRIALRRAIADRTGADRSTTVRRDVDGAGPVARLRHVRRR
jgi:cobalt-zinc-cadmium efflux system outer membrane protein